MGLTLNTERLARNTEVISRHGQKRMKDMNNARTRNQTYP